MTETYFAAVRNSSEDNNGNHNGKSAEYVGSAVDEPARSATPAVVLPSGNLGQFIPGLGKATARTIIDPLAAQHFQREPLEFRIFEDGSFVDLVGDPSTPEKPSLLIIKGGRATIQNEFHYGGKVFVPRQLEPSLLAAIRFPTEIVRSGSTQEVFHELEECISTYIDLSRNQLVLVAIFVMASWFQDRLPVAPYLWLTGPPESGKTTLLRLLDCLCRRPVMAGDVTPAALYSLPTALIPTLLLDEFEVGRGGRSRDQVRFLRMGSTRGGRAARGSKLYETFCAKVIASRERPPDAALASRAIFVSMLPTSQVLPTLDDAALNKIAGKFQALMESYRLENYSRVSSGTTTSGPDFSPRMQSLARSLAAPLLGEEKLTLDLFNTLAEQDRERRIDRRSEPEWVVATALYEQCHRTTGGLTMGTLATEVDIILANLGETYSLTPRRVGGIVHSLGLPTQKLGNQGRGLWLDQATIRQIHALAQRFGLKRSDILDYRTVDAGYGGFHCPACEQYGLMKREDGLPLKCGRMPRPRRGLND
jgi:hypothetical protein